MGLLTGLAIGGALAGGLFAGRKLAGGNNQQQPQAPQTAVPVAPGSQLGPTPPQINPGANMAAADAAAARTRKRAASGNLLTPRPPKADSMPTNPSIRPKTLIGY